jgi:hypothetical protein
MRDLIARLARLHLDALYGGITIETPQGPTPVLRSVIQFDGDIQNFVFYPKGQSDAVVPPEIAERHLASMAARVESYAGWRKFSAVFEPAALGLLLTGYIGAFLRHGSLTGLAVELGLSTVPAGLRFMAPKVTRKLLKGAMQKFSEDRKNRNDVAVARLRARRVRLQPEPDSETRS